MYCNREIIKLEELHKKNMKESYKQFSKLRNFRAVKLMAVILAAAKFPAAKIPVTVKGIRLKLGVLYTLDPICHLNKTCTDY